MASLSSQNNQLKVKSPRHDYERNLSAMISRGQLAQTSGVLPAGMALRINSSQASFAIRLPSSSGKYSGIIDSKYSQTQFKFLRL